MVLMLVYVRDKRGNAFVDCPFARSVFHNMGMDADGIPPVKSSSSVIGYIKEKVRHH